MKWRDDESDIYGILALLFFTIGVWVLTIR